MNIFGYNRIILIGNNGSGKSFLSKELAVITGINLVHLDAEFWRPNWEKPPIEEWIKKQTEFISMEKWIIDGNHTETMELRFKAAELVIFLDLIVLYVWQVYLKDTAKSVRICLNILKKD